MTFKCPNCQSENIQKLSLIYQAGSSDFSAVTRGAGIGTGGLGIGGASTDGTQVSGLAKKYAPPPKFPAIKTFVLGFVAALIAGAIANSNLVTWIGIVLSIALGIFFLYSNFKVHPVAMEKWNRKYLCMRCETLISK